MKGSFSTGIKKTNRRSYFTAFTKSSQPYRSSSSSDGPHRGLSTHQESLNAWMMSS